MCGAANLSLRNQQLERADASPKDLAAQTSGAAVGEIG
jgi:hypothetical protein